MIALKLFSRYSKTNFKTFTSVLQYDFSTHGTYENVKHEKKGNVALVRIARANALNPLNSVVCKELVTCLELYDADPEIGAIVLTGSDKAFAAGADIMEMKDKKYPETYATSMLSGWDKIMSIKKPIIGAVNGYALGGGCELAMLCDIIFAGTKAKFGQPEVAIGTIPGMGGTQRLIRAVGKSKAMELILTGRQFDAVEAEKFGLVSAIYEPEKLVEESLKVAEKIASYSHSTIAMAKDCVNKAEELSLTTGLAYEKALFWSTFATADQKEGMGAFAEKRKPKFTH
mmetsp:Transcript_29378/g.33955  ORF Transcript_29378/g.33955 Transcript_29378/m.33955 type:complete len:286 (-) Transcript_29378:154-1011(-)